MNTRKRYPLKAMNSRIEIESLKERISLTRVVGHYLPLEKRGAAYIGLCPFHDDHHPSLRVDPAKGLYHCFSCREGGDVFRFVQQKEGCSFGEAVRICADICHLPLPGKPAEAKKKPASQPQPVPAVADNELFRQTLLPYDPGMEELKEIYRLFEVGLAPDCVPGAYAFTTRRLVFPIRSAEGGLVAFAARYLGDGQGRKIPKYLNSPTSPLYKKDTLLYGWHRAVEEVRRTGVLYLTEGYKDTLAMHAAGFTNTVALCGVNLSTVQIDDIRREARTVCLLLDADKAGRQTAEGLLPLLRKSGLRGMNLLPEGGKDPDEMFRTMGREGFIQWVRRNSLSPLRRKLEGLLVAVCRRWPDTCCLTADGDTQLYWENITEVLRYENMLPGYAPVPASDAEIDYQYALHTVSHHSEEVRHSELVRYLFLCYLEVRFTERVRTDSRRLSRLSQKVTDERTELLEKLQYEREYLERVTGELQR